MAVSYTVRDSAELTGIVVRDEEVLYSVYSTVYISAAEGKMVSRGGEIASAFESDEDLQKAVRKSELETEISQIETVKKNGDLSADRQRQESEIAENILELKSDVYSGNLTDIENRTIQLKTLVFTGTNGAGDIQEQLDGLKAELNELKRAAGLNTRKIYASASGIFSRTVDGWEDLKPDGLGEITASGLKQLLNEKREIPNNALGKLVFGTRWYYIALMNREDCEKLNQGDRADLIFGRYSAKTLRMKTESISGTEDGKCAVVFSCDRSMADNIYLRQQEAQLVFNEYTGIRVPKKSLHVDENGKTFVYVQTALQAEEKYAEIVYDLGDFYVVSNDDEGIGGEEAESNEKTNRLRIGDQIIVSAKKLYNGKVVD